MGERQHPEPDYGLGMPPLPPVVVVVVVEVVVLVAVEVVVVGVLVVVVGVVVVVGMVELVAVVVLVSPPLSEDATTASATPRPITTATSVAIAHLTPRLMPGGGGGSPGGGPAPSGWPIWRVGSSCISGRV